MPPKRSSLLRLTADPLLLTTDFLKDHDVATLSLANRALRRHFSSDATLRRRLIANGVVAAPAAADGEPGSPLKRGRSDPDDAEDDQAAAVAPSYDGRVVAHVVARSFAPDHGAAQAEARLATARATMRILGQTAPPVTSSPTTASNRAREVNDHDGDGAATAGPQVRDDDGQVPRGPVVTTRDVFLRSQYSFSSCRTKPVAEVGGLLMNAGVADREGSDMVTLSDGHTIFKRAGFCRDPLAWTFSYVTKSVRPWVPEVLVDRGDRPLSVQSHQITTYGHHLSLISDRDHVVQYGGCTVGAYRGMVAELTVSFRCPRSNFEFALPRDVYDRTTRIQDLDHDDLPLMRTIAFELDHPDFPARAFQGQCTDEDRKTLYLFGGLLENGRTDNKLLKINIEKLLACVESASALVDGPPSQERYSRATRLRLSAWSDFVDGEAVMLPDIRGRFGHSMVCVRGKLYIAGGYTGSGMFNLFDGIDLTDVYMHDPASGVTTIIATRCNAISGFLGRCHSANTYGPYIAYYGGTSRYSNRLVLFDTRDNTLRKHDDGVVKDDGLNVRMRKRVSHAAAMSGHYLVIAGGCSFDDSIMSDFAIDLAPLPPREGDAVLPKLTIGDIANYEGPAHPRPRNPHGGGFGAAAFAMAMAGQEEDEEVEDFAEDDGDDDDDDDEEEVGSGPHWFHGDDDEEEEEEDDDTLDSEDLRRIEAELDHEEQQEEADDAEEETDTDGEEDERAAARTDTGNRATATEPKRDDSDASSENDKGSPAPGVAARMEAVRRKFPGKALGGRHVDPHAAPPPPAAAGEQDDDEDDEAAADE